MTSENNNNGALSGVKVIDLTRVLSGPFCTMLLAKSIVQKGPESTLVKSITFTPESAPLLLFSEVI